MEGYTAVIFSSRHTGDDEGAYDEMAARMDQLAAAQPGYIGVESVRDADGRGITVSYWVDDDAARAWKRETEHLAAQARGRSSWYDTYRVRIATVEREYGFARPIFHLAVPDDWAEAERTGTYSMSTRGITVEQEGFVHCSLAHQVVGVADRFYADVDELVVLHLDREVLEDALRFEPPADGIDELFPHVYRAIPTAAVTTATVWRRDGEVWADPPLTT